MEALTQLMPVQAIFLAVMRKQPVSAIVRTLPEQLRRTSSTVSPSMSVASIGFGPMWNRLLLSGRPER